RARRGRAPPRRRRRASGRKARQRLQQPFNPSGSVRRKKASGDGPMRLQRARILPIPLSINHRRSGLLSLAIERAHSGLRFHPRMSDSQRFPVAAHALAYLAHRGAFDADQAVSSAALAASMPTNPVVVRRVTAMLAKAGLIGARAGATGGYWL